jgi:hypothetical protein
VKQQISDMAVNGSGIRDTAQVLKISPMTVIEDSRLCGHPFSVVLLSASEVPVESRFCPFPNFCATFVCLNIAHHFCD